MKAILRKYLLATSLIALCMVFVSCSGDDQAEEKKPSKAIGSYSIDGVEHNIVNGVYVVANGYYEFMFTPCESLTSDRHTTIILNVLSAFDGRELDVERFYHNDDYIFSYEDNFFYYSRFNALKSGTIMVTRKGENSFSVEMNNIELPDGRPFELSFDGELPSVYDIEE